MHLSEKVVGSPSVLQRATGRVDLSKQGMVGLGRIKARRRIHCACIRQCGDYLTDENDVGLRNELLIEATIGPSLSLSVRAAIQVGSVWKAFHLVSHSAIESQVSM